MKVALLADLAVRNGDRDGRVPAGTVGLLVPKGDERVRFASLAPEPCLPVQLEHEGHAFVVDLDLRVIMALDDEAAAAIASHRLVG